MFFLCINLSQKQKFKYYEFDTYIRFISGHAYKGFFDAKSMTIEKNQIFAVMSLEIFHGFRTNMSIFNFKDTVKSENFCHSLNCQVLRFLFTSIFIEKKSS